MDPFLIVLLGWLIAVSLFVVLIHSARSKLKEALKKIDKGQRLAEEVAAAHVHALKEAEQCVAEIKRKYSGLISWKRRSIA